MRTLLAAATLTAAAVAGCGRPTPAPAPAPAAPGEPTNRPLVDNPDYVNWKRFPLGTVVKRKIVASSEVTDGTTTSVETFTLREVTDREVTVERQNTTERSDGSYRADNPPELRKYVRRFPIPAGMSADDFARPARTARKTGEEVLTVLGKPYKAEVYEWTDRTEAGPLAVKVWVSGDMPGRIVRQVMTLPSLRNKTVDEVVAVTIP